MAGKQGIQIRDEFSIKVFESQMRTLVRGVNRIKPFYDDLKLNLNLRKPFYKVAKLLYEKGVKAIDGDIEAFIKKEVGSSQMLRKMILREIQPRVDRLDQEIEVIKNRVEGRIYSSERQTAGGFFFGLEWASEDTENDCLKFGEEQLKEAGDKLFTPTLKPDVERLYEAAMGLRYAFRTFQDAAAEVTNKNVETVNEAALKFFTNDNLEDVNAHVLTKIQLSR